MMRSKNVVFILLLLFAIVGCAPDLTVTGHDVVWNGTSKVAKAKIANIGNKNAGNFMVYFNGDEDPVSQNHIPSVAHNIPSLAKGATIELTADFAGLAHPDNNNLGNVFKITVIVDPKYMVKESNENNNIQEILLP